MGQYEGCRSIVNREEEKIRTLCLSVVKLCGEVTVGVIRESSRTYDFKSLGLSLGREFLIDTGRISIAVVVDYRNLGAELLLFNILCGSNALVRVGKAHLEYIVLALNGNVAVAVGLTAYNVGRRSGRSKLENLIGVGLGGNRNAGLCGNGAHKDLHTPVFQLVVSVD